MAKKTATKAKAKAAIAKEAPAAQPPMTLPLRLPYPRSIMEKMGVDAPTWKVLTEAVWPNATTPESVFLAISYCQAQKLDPIKRVVHIVPIWSKEKNAMIEGVWPGIALLRTTAARTGAYAGMDDIAFGPEMVADFVEVDTRNDAEKDRLDEFEYPDWAQATVYRIVQGQRCMFVGPKVYWREAYATKNRFSEIPNDMWRSRPRGQLAKCAEAAALRLAFPEALGNEYAAEELGGRSMEAIGSDPPGERAVVIEGQVTPPAPHRSDFEPSSVEERKPHTSAKPAEKKPQAKPKPKPEPSPAPKEPTVTEAPKPLPLTDATDVMVEFLRQGRSELDKVSRALDIPEIRDRIAAQLEGAHKEAWLGDCAAKIDAIKAARK